MCFYTDRNHRAWAERKKNTRTSQINDIWLFFIHSLYLNWMLDAFVIIRLVSSRVSCFCKAVQCVCVCLYDVDVNRTLLIQRKTRKVHFFPNSLFICMAWGTFCYCIRLMVHKVITSEWIFELHVRFTLISGINSAESHSLSTFLPHRVATRSLAHSLARARIRISSVIMPVQNYRAETGGLQFHSICIAHI